MPATAIVQGLAGIRRLRLGIYAWLASALPMLAVGVIFPAESQTFVLAWAVVGLALVVRHTLTRCPRCHEFFNWSATRKVKFVRACVACGLSLHPERE